MGRQLNEHQPGPMLARQAEVLLGSNYAGPHALGSGSVSTTYNDIVR